MKNAILIGTGALLLVFGISAPAFAQEQHDPQEQPAKPPDAKPTEKPQAAPPKTPDDRPRPDNAKNHPKKPNTKKTPSTHKTQRPPRTPATDGFRTTSTRAFGREHTFHVGHPGDRRRPGVSYGGYSFVIAQTSRGGLGI